MTSLPFKFNNSDALQTQRQTNRFNYGYKYYLTYMWREIHGQVLYDNGNWYSGV